MDTLCKVDIAEYGSNDRTVQNLVVVKVEMRGCVERAAVAAGIPLDECEIQDDGDGFLILAPEIVDRGAFVDDFLRALVDELRNHNEKHLRAEQIRLRLALHAGEVFRGKANTVGHCINHTQRLLDVKLLKKALAKSTGPLAVIVSDWFYQEVVRQRAEYEPSAYRKIFFNVKETTGVGWIRLPGHDHPVIPFPRLREMFFAVDRLGRRLGR